LAARAQSSRPKPSDAPSKTLDANISRSLVLVSSAVRLRISHGLEEKGHHLSVAVTHIVTNLPPDGLRMSALARRAGLSLQRAGQLVAQLEEDGYVRRVTDSDDGRARRVVYTRRGGRLLRDIDSMLQETNGLLGQIVGESRFGKLMEDLEKLDRALNSNVEGFRIVAD
jgi:DNA-binding MarR family transcriptional regulator